MSHHRLLTPAARPRHATPRGTQRLTLFLLVFLTLAAGAPFAAAEMVYYTEDFCNDGEPGFDPMFNHEFIEPAGHPAYMYPMWDIRMPSPGFSDVYRLVMGFGTKDIITFNLAADEYVRFAQVTVSPELNWLGEIRFIGTKGEWQTSANEYGQERFEVWSTTIGSINTIELSGIQDGIGFSSVTIGVVPEPVGLLLLLAGLQPALFLRGRATPGLSR